MKKNNLMYGIIILLAVLFLWQSVSKSSLKKQVYDANRYYDRVRVLSGIGPLKSAHHHADIKFYLNGKQVDFSQKKYQLANTFIHFEEGIGDIVHSHATGLTLGHLFKSLGMELTGNCLLYEGKNYCNDGNSKLKFYVNGKPNYEFDNKLVVDKDKYLISYGNESDAEVKQQIDSVTSLASK